MTSEQYAKLKDGDELVITQHGKNRGKRCIVINATPDYRRIHVRLIDDGDFFDKSGSKERVMAHESLGFPMNEKYMTIMDVSALSFHEMWDGRDDYFTPGRSLSDSVLLKWLNLGLIKGKRFLSNNAAGHTWGIPVSELPKIRQLFETPPDTNRFPKVTRSSDGFITWQAYMDSMGEKHV